jgi:membrane protein
VAILRAAAKEFLDDGGARLGAALSYYTLFSLVPLLFLTAAVAGYVFRDPDAVTEVVEWGTDLAGEKVGDSLGSLVETVQEQRSGTLSIGIALSAFAAAGIFQQVQAVLGIIFHVPREKRRDGLVGWVVRRLIGIASAVGLAILVFTPLVAVAGIDWLIDLLPADPGWLLSLVQFGVPISSVVMLMLVTGFTFQVLSAVKIPWKAALRGGATTAVIGLTAALLVGVYLNTAGATGTLGALGGAAILLFFFNLMWLVYLYGAEVTKTYSDYLRYGDVMQPTEREKALASSGRAPAHAAVSGATDTASERPAESRTFLAGAVLGWLLGRGGRK